MNSLITSSCSAIGIVILLSFLPPDEGRLPGEARSIHDTCARKAADSDSAASCGKCHVAVFNEWKGKAHSHAWTNPVYQNAIKNKKRPQSCHACHTPDQVLERVGRKPKTRDDILEEGVTCVSCHKLGEEEIHGPFGAETEAHTSKKSPHFTLEGSNGLCASCHSTKIGPVVPVGRDYTRAEGPKGKEKKSCVECHMPEVERHLAIDPETKKPVGPKRKNRRHGMLGPDDAEFCATAFSFESRKDGAEIVLEVENKAAHRVPGLTLRKFVFTAQQLDGADKEVGKGEAEITGEDYLQIFETREFRFPAAPTAAALKIVVEQFFEEEKGEEKHWVRVHSTEHTKIIL